MAFTLVTVTANYDRPDGADPAGTVSFTPTVPMINDQTVVAAPVSRELNIDGRLVIQVAANTDPGTTPTDARYLVKEEIEGVFRSYYVQVPHNAGAFIDLTALAPVAATPAPVPVAPSPPSTFIYSIPGAPGPAGPPGPGKLLDDFYPGVGDFTSAFAAAAAWSVANKQPVHIRASATPYVTSQPIPVGLNCQFIGTYQPPWAASVNSDIASVIVSPAVGFPNSRGLFEISNTARASALRGMSLQGLGRGTSISGIKLATVASTPELGLVLSDLDIGGFTGDGITGAGRVIFLTRLFVHENSGYGLNFNDTLYDSRVEFVYSYWNHLGGMNIDSDSQLNTFYACRFERSGQVPFDPQNQLSSASWNTAAPGIRMRGGQRIQFVQCDTDANTGPGLDIQVTSSSPTYRPIGCTFVACVFNRDGQGDAKTSNPTGSGVKVKGFANIGGQNVPFIRFVECAVLPYVSNDSGDTGWPFNPERGVWIENTEFTSFITGGQVDGNTIKFYFGSSADPATNNWRAYFLLPQYGVFMPAPPETTPFTTTGMLRENGSLQRWNGSAWVTV